MWFLPEHWHILPLSDPLVVRSRPKLHGIPVNCLHVTIWITGNLYTFHSSLHHLQPSDNHRCAPDNGDHQSCNCFVVISIHRKEAQNSFQHASVTPQLPDYRSTYHVAFNLFVSVSRLSSPPAIVWTWPISLPSTTALDCHRVPSALDRNRHQCWRDCCSPNVILFLILL